MAKEEKLPLKAVKELIERLGPVPSTNCCCGRETCHIITDHTTVRVRLKHEQDNVFVFWASQWMILNGALWWHQCLLSDRETLCWIYWGYTDINWCHNPGLLPFLGYPELCVVSLETKITCMRLSPWLCSWPCLSKGLNLIMEISLPEFISDYALIITHHFAGCVLRHLVLCWISGSVYTIWYLLGSGWLECCCSLLLLACLEPTPV